MNQSHSPSKERPSFWEQALFGFRVTEPPRFVPGLLLALGIALAAQLIASALGAALLRPQGLDPAGKGSPISAISVAVLLGLLIANTVGVSKAFAPGLDFSVKKILRLGIILVGIKLSVLDVLKVGSLGIPVVLALVVFALVASLWVPTRKSSETRRHWRLPPSPSSPATRCSSASSPRSPFSMRNEPAMLDAKSSRSASSSPSSSWASSPCLSFAPWAT